MSRKKPSKIAQPPMFWEGAHDDPAHWLGVGADLVLDGQQLYVNGAPVGESLGSWFDRTRPIIADSIERVFCHCGAGPVAEVQRVWQVGKRTVAVIRYQLRRRTDTGSEMTLHRAVLHIPTPDNDCAHGSLLLHPIDGLTAHCLHHRLNLEGMDIARWVRNAHGGWSDDGPSAAPKPGRAVVQRHA